MRTIAGIVGIALVSAALYVAGRHAQSIKADLVKARAEAKAHANALTEYEASVKEVNRLAAAHAQVITKTRTITKEIIREVPRLVPVDACPLPAGFRLLHDAAATGQAVDPAPAPGTDGGPVAAQEAAEVIVDNYGQYHELADRHRSLQQYVREQLKW